MKRPLRITIIAIILCMLAVALSVTLTEGVLAHGVLADAPSRYYQPGDANEDGVINMADITTIERMILGLEGPTLGADVDENGIDMGDVIKVERIILGIDPLPPLRPTFRVAPIPGLHLLK